MTSQEVVRNYITGILDICQDQKGPVGSLSSEILNFIIVTDIKEDDTTEMREQVMQITIPVILFISILTSWTKT